MVILRTGKKKHLWPLLKSSDCPKMTRFKRRNIRSLPTHECLTGIASRVDKGDTQRPELNVLEALLLTFLRHRKCLQGDASGCSLGFVDIEIKVAF